MQSNRYFRIIALAFIAIFQAPAAQAQFGGLFGGPKLETIETADLAKMLQKQQAAEEKAKETAADSPQADFVVVDVRSDAEVNVSVT